jgi:hypothetical protein
MQRVQHDGMVRSTLLYKALARVAALELRPRVGGHGGDVS